MINIEELARELCKADGYHPDADTHVYRESPKYKEYLSQAQAAADNLIEQLIGMAGSDERNKLALTACGWLKHIRNSND